MNCGDIVTLPYPFTDMSGSKVRPALIISANTFNTSEDRVLLPISSMPDPNDPNAYYIPQTHPSFSGTGLKTDSSVKWTKPTVLSKSLILRRIGTLDAATVAAIAAKVRSIF